MSNIALAYPDYLLATAYTTALSNGNWTAAFPLNNLKNALRQKVARSTNATAAYTKITVDLGVARATQFLAILNHNITHAGTVRFRFYSDAGLTTLVSDAGTVDVWASTHPDAEALNGFKPDYYRVLAAPVTARYVLVEITDTTNTAGYVELGRLMFAPIWTPATNIAYGCSVGWQDDDTTSERSIGGVDWFDNRSKRRAAGVSLEVLTDVEAFQQVMDMTRKLGISGEVYFVFDPANTDWYLMQRSFLARMNRLGVLQIPDYGRNTGGFEFAEIL